MSDLEHTRYADWDAAYVLGSLSRSERSEYEAHVTECKICRTAIGELAPLPGLLARLDEAEALALLDEAAEAAPPVAVAIKPRRRRGFALVAAGLAAAALVAVALVIPSLGTSSPSVAASISLSQTAPSPLTASVKLTAAAWGTRIDMVCTYAAGYEGTESAYRLYVLDRSGHSSLVSSWHAGPGDVARTTGSSDLSPSQISVVQVRNSSGAVLLTGRA